MVKCEYNHENEIKHLLRSVKLILFQMGEILFSDYNLVLLKKMNVCVCL